MPLQFAFFTFRSISQGVKYRLFSNKNRLHAVNLTIANLHWDVPKNFVKSAQQKLDACTF